MFSPTQSYPLSMTLPDLFAAGPENTAQRERFAVVVFVLILHAGFGGAWIMQPEQPAPLIKEMSVSVAMQQAPALPSQAEPRPPRQQPKTEHTDKPADKPLVRDASDVAPLPLAAPPPPVAAAPVAAAPVVDTEPDYKAGYLNNPRPAYPMVARKMGWEGRVILDVEVLAEGICGSINVFSSSGREVLDSAAIHTVKGWHFSPARHGGRSITKWFKVPVNFSLEDSEA